VDIRSLLRACPQRRGRQRPGQRQPVQVAPHR
jgi:hypothetical protein